MPSGLEAVGGYYATYQMNSSYREAYSQGQILNGFGLISVSVWTYSWFYKGKSFMKETTKLEDSDWTWDFHMRRQADKESGVFIDNQYVVQFTGRIK